MEHNSLSNIYKKELDLKLELIKYTYEFEVSLVELINKQKEYNYYNKKVIELENSLVLKYPSKYDFNLKFINLNKVY